MGPQRAHRLAAASATKPPCGRYGRRAETLTTCLGKLGQCKLPMIVMKGLDEPGLTSTRSGLHQTALRFFWLEWMVRIYPLMRRSTRGTIHATCWRARQQHIAAMPRGHRSPECSGGGGSARQAFDCWRLPSGTGQHTELQVNRTSSNWISSGMAGGRSSATARGPAGDRQANRLSSATVLAFAALSTGGRRITNIAG